MSDPPVALAGAYPLQDPGAYEIRGTASDAAPRTSPRLLVHGKFLFAGGQKIYLRGATYGTFAPGPDGDGYPHDIESDFAMMRANGINAIRTYTAPPGRLLDAARRHGLRILVGLAWEHHVAFLDDPGRDDDIVARVRADVRRLSGHPAILGYAVGNEIPAPIVRWHGARSIERFIERLCRATREEDPRALVTYVNYPSTEYLHLPMLDFVCFNVYLEHQTVMRPYLAHLHHIAGDRPLVMTEIGLDSRRHGNEDQALSLDWQVRTTFASGCAGAFVFAWTDEWHRGGHDVKEWDFGLVDRQRQPKLALAAVREAFANHPFPLVRWPRISVVVCSHNGARTIRDCCEGLRALEYPDFEVIVVDDGSTDPTASIAEEYGFRVLRTKNRGLSRARNLGLSFTRGEIIAYLDDDARPDPHWLSYLAATFLSAPHAAVGGPNITPPEDGPIAACVANAPGGPIHVLLSDLEAEHIPGCNMAFRKETLIEIGGFDPRFRTAGDDVDVCWRLQDAGYTLGFSPAAMVWHHRRNSMRAYWRQQEGYGEAEALLERKWPERYNAPGHLTWSGRLYSNGHRAGWDRGRVYQGVWGSAPFQSLYQPAPGLLWSLPAMPEWYLAIGCLAILAALGIAWAPLLWALPPLVVALAAPLIQAILGGARATFREPGLGSGERLRRRVLTAWLHAIQPIARLRGRVRSGLTPWRRRRGYSFALPRPFTFTAWSESWRDPDAWVREIERRLRDIDVIVRIGGEYDRWDLEVRVGTLGSMRLRMAVEEHGWGRQLVRLRAWPRPYPAAVVLGGLFSTLAAMAADGGSAIAAIVLAGLALPALVGMVRDAGAAQSAVKRAARKLTPAARDELAD